MSPLAMGLSGVYRVRAVASHDVLYQRNGVKMPWIDTRSVLAKVVQKWRRESMENLVSNPMRIQVLFDARFRADKELSVSVLLLASEPFPARKPPSAAVNL